MTKNKLIEIHKKLHKSLDQLLACFIKETNKSLGKTNLMEFLEWSHKQTISPNCYKPKQKKS